MPTLVAKECQLVPRKQIAAEPEGDAYEKQEHAADPRDLTRRTVRAHEIYAEHMYEQRQDQKVCGPTVNGADQPAKLDLGNDELNALKSALGAWPVIKQKQDAGHDLDRKQEKGHAAEVVPDRMAMERNLLLLCQADNGVEPKSLIKPEKRGFFIDHGIKPSLR